MRDLLEKSQLKTWENELKSDLRKSKDERKKRRKNFRSVYRNKNKTLSLKRRGRKLKKKSLLKSRQRS